MTSQLKSIISVMLLRRPMVAAVAVTMILIGSSFWVSCQGLALLAVLLVCQASRGTPIKQGFNVIFAIVAAIFLAFALSSLFVDASSLSIVAMVVFVVAIAAAILERDHASRKLKALTLFSFVLVLGLLSPSRSIGEVGECIATVFISGVLGILICHFLSPVNPYAEFSAGVLPILSALKNYLHVFRQVLSSRQADFKMMSPSKMQIQNALQSHDGMYPEWVYEFGFNPGLRAGFRFFLVNIERVTETIFSMDYLSGNEDLFGGDQELIKNIDIVIQRNEELLQVLITRFTKKEIMQTTSDYTSDVTALEAALHKVAPAKLELLELEPSKIPITAFVRDLVDLRKLLLQLVMALPA